MHRYFGRTWDGPAFVLFGPAHLAALAIIVTGIVVLVRTFRHADEPTRRRVRLVLAWALWIHEVCWHLWNVLTGQWSADRLLPLHLCSAIVWLSGVMLLTKSRRLYEVVYFLGIGGATQALLTPDLAAHNFPHYRFFETMFAHAMIIVAACWMTFVERFRPTWVSVRRVLIYLTCYALLVFVINLALGSNYLFINHKPEFDSVISVLPAWPYYVAYLGLFAVVLVLALYAPWAARDRWRRQLSAG